MRQKKIPFAVAIILLVILFLAIFFMTKKADAPSASTRVKDAKSTKKIVPPSQPAFNKQSQSTTDPANPWVVVNKRRALDPKTYAPQDLVLVSSKEYLRQAAAAAFSDLKKAAASNGLTLQALSGYRSYQTQVSVYNKEVATVGKAVADTESARPGYSEHQTGWAVDVGGGGCGIEDCFGKTAEGAWLAAHAYEYGFIIRYIEGKQTVTGYRPEPWHIRYVGTDLAQEMHRSGVLTLEEFFGLDSAPDYSKSDS